MAYRDRQGILISLFRRSHNINFLNLNLGVASLFELLALETRVYEMQQDLLHTFDMLSFSFTWNNLFLKFSFLNSSLVVRKFLIVLTTRSL